MKYSIFLGLLFTVTAAPVWSGDDGTEGKARMPAHSPEWTNARQGDPGTTSAESTGGAQIAPSQTKVKLGAATADDEAGSIRFGDGKHGSRLPTQRTAPVSVESDPDRPLVTSSMPSNGLKKAKSAKTPADKQQKIEQ